MKTFLALLVVVALSVFCSCQKEQTEAERKAEIDREVQQRLDAEHQAQEKEQLAQRETELSAREKEVAQKESAATATQPPERETRSARTEQRTARIDERGPTASYNTFYTKLDRYGAWRETGDYGYVWQPREAEASRNWRPYTNGRWVYTDAGWTWISNEPFGWATYHYGRWTRLRNIGWVWVPGDEWAPAWVSWRKSNDYVGWAPLPPEARFDRRTGIHNWSDNYYDIGPDQYAFVPVNEFGAQRIESTVVPRERNVTIINQTTNVTNITYSNTTVINQGPDYDEARSRSREPIQRLRIQRETTVDFGAEGPRPMVRGEVVVVTAPVFAAPQRAERPPTVKETIAQAAVDLGWAAITNHQEAEKARAKMKSEVKAQAPANAPSKKFVKPESAPATEATAAPATSTSSSTAVTATASPAESATVTPLPKATEQPHAPARSAETPETATSSTATPAPTATPNATSSQATSPSVSPRQSRLLTPSVTPRRAMPPPASTSSVSPMTPPASSPSPTSTVSSTPPLQSRDKHEVREEQTIPPRTLPTPSPSASVLQEQGEQKTAERKQLRGVESQAQKFQKRQIVPMTSPGSPTSTPTSTSSPTTSGASAPSASPAEKLTKQEKKEQKREHKDQKRERKEGAETSESVTPSPQSSP